MCGCLLISSTLQVGEGAQPVIEESDTAEAVRLTLGAKIAATLENNETLHIGLQKYCGLTPYTVTIYHMMNILLGTGCSLLKITPKR